MEIQELRDKILEILNIGKETPFSDNVLCQMLKKRRNKYHSDNITDDVLKEDFDKNFIELDRLYKDFTNAIIGEKQSNEIILVSKDLDYIETKKENIELEETLKTLKQENQQQEKTIKDLKDRIKIVSRDSILKERESLINAIKPKKKDYFKTLGVIASLTLGLNILTKFESISYVLRESFSVNANYVLLSLFSIICIMFLYNLIREHIINNISLSICTVKFVRDFKNYYEKIEREREIEVEIETDYYFENYCEDKYARREYFERRERNRERQKERDYYYENYCENINEKRNYFEKREREKERDYYLENYKDVNVRRYYLNKKRCGDFSESDVLNYITHKFKIKQGFINWLYKKMFNIYNDATLETLKKIFILELQNNKLIRLGAVYELEQQYIIIRQHIEKENGEVYLKEY